MSRYSPSGLNVAPIWDALAQVDTRTDEQREMDRLSAKTVRAAKVIHLGRTTLRVPPPFSEAPLPRPRRASRGPRGTTNVDQRGNTTDRHRRKIFLLTEFGDGDHAPCYRCGVLLDLLTITVDRIVPGCEGGRYIRSNIRPACSTCNTETGAALATRHLREDDDAGSDLGPDRPGVAAAEQAAAS